MQEGSIQSSGKTGPHEQRDRPQDSDMKRVGRERENKSYRGMK